VICTGAYSINAASPRLPGFYQAPVGGLSVCGGFKERFLGAGVSRGLSTSTLVVTARLHKNTTAGTTTGQPEGKGALEEARKNVKRTFCVEYSKLL
jgi:hypothetical protein